MKDLSLHIMDIVQNSILADSTDISITILESAEWLILTVADNGIGMNQEQQEQLRNPFYTHQPNKLTGLGVPLLVQAAEKTGGTVQVESWQNTGTTLVARFRSGHVDQKPLGDIATTIALLLAINPEIFFRFSHRLFQKEYHIDSKSARQMDFVQIKQYINQQETALNQAD